MIFENFSLSGLFGGESAEEAEKQRKIDELKSLLREEEALRAFTFADRVPGDSNKLDGVQSKINALKQELGADADIDMLAGV